MGKVLIIGAGSVGNVVAKKCAQIPEVFSDITLASRTLEKCKKIRSEIKSNLGIDINTTQVNADEVQEVVDLIEDNKPDVLIHVALPYQDLTIMKACLKTGVHYVDTANYESPKRAKFEYKRQWALSDTFKKSGLTANLGVGFDPGATNAMIAYMLKHYFSLIRTIDIVDCNAGDHGYYFATNFNPEANLREVSQKGKYWEKGKWIETFTVIEQWHRNLALEFDYPVVGKKKSYLIYHEELESLVKNTPGLERIRFWMTFGDRYLNCLEVFKNTGMLGIEEIDYEGLKIPPIRFLGKVLPDPSTLGINYKGKTSIGCLVDGITKENGRKKYLIFNVCDHAECYKEVQGQAVAYTTGVPAMIGAKLIIEGPWRRAGVNNVEELDPDPFMDDLNKYGLPWKVEEFDGSLPDIIFK